jgi:hypothetical protein
VGYNERSNCCLPPQWAQIHTVEEKANVRNQSGATFDLCSWISPCSSHANSHPDVHFEPGETFIVKQMKPQTGPGATVENSNIPARR